MLKQRFVAFFLIFSLINLLIPYSSPTFAAPEINNAAVEYLKTKDPSPWSTMALVAAGETGLSADHLKGNPGDQAINYTAPIMAISAIGEDPRTYPDENFVAKLKSFHSNGQIGDENTLNDDIFGLLALVSSGEPLTDPAIQDAKTTIVSNQRPDGGWGFVKGGNSDTNMTAMAIMALLEVGFTDSSTEIQNAITYLQSAQNEDGGFPYDPYSQFSTDSDASSDAWVISALYKLGIDPASWSKNGTNPIEHLESLQAQEGYFQYILGSGEDTFSPITTSYATIALAGFGYPVVSLSSNVPKDPVVSFRIEGSFSTICKGVITSATALDVVINASDQCGYTYVIEDTSFGPYLSQINDEKGEGMNGWMYTVNNTTPSVGSADYKLESGDTVLWFYGAFDDESPVFDATSQSVSLEVDITAKDNSLGSSDNDTISFIVNPDTLNFGNLEPGDSVSDTLTITNTGDIDIYVEALISGDEIFTSRLELDSQFWPFFNSTVNAGASDQVEATLRVPSSYSGEGSKNGTLIFWAVAN